jgi:lipoprotein-releasing system ATP-binding protein
MLLLTNISKGFGIPGSSNFRLVLDGLDFEAEKGESIAIVGPSGSGKTTALNIIGTLDIPDHGKVLFEDRDLTTLNSDELAEFRNRKLGFVFQLHHLLPQLTLMENVLLPVLPFKKRATSDDVSWAEYLIKKVGIWDQRNQKPSEMSGGECQRTAVVRALINKPSLLLADEPTGALDQRNAEILSDLLVTIGKEEGIALITVTHAASLADRMKKAYNLVDGKLIRIR